jgi:hypothetical protein
MYHGLPGGKGGAGTKLQFTVGFFSTGPVVVCENVDATVYDQSHATMLPGALDVDPLNVQSRVLPLLVSVQVSDSLGPLTPKLAVATVGFVTEIDAVAVDPPYEPVTVPEIVPPTLLVSTENVALIDPAATVTLGGTVSGSAAESDTDAPPAGAEPVSVAVPVTGFPPTTVAALNEIAASATPVPTVSVGESALFPLTVAWIVIVPGATPVTVNAALDDPAGIVTGL